MPITIRCPQCNRQAIIPDTAVGKSVKCSCGNTFIAGSPEPEEFTLQPIKVQKQSEPETNQPVAPVRRGTILNTKRKPIVGARRQGSDDKAKLKPKADWKPIAALFFLALVVVGVVIGLKQSAGNSPAVTLADNIARKDTAPNAPPLPIAAKSAINSNPATVVETQPMVVETSQETKDLLKSLRFLSSSTHSGINYIDFSSEYRKVKFQFDEWLRTNDARNLPKLNTAISAAINDYQTIGLLWKEKINNKNCITYNEALVSLYPDLKKKPDDGGANCEYRDNSLHLHWLDGDRTIQIMFRYASASVEKTSTFENQGK